MGKKEIKMEEEKKDEKKDIKNDNKIEEEKNEEIMLNPNEVTFPSQKLQEN